jgi:hypothetical protein
MLSSTKVLDDTKLGHVIVAVDDSDEEKEQNNEFQQGSIY